jgi:hypothetical protein
VIERHIFGAVLALSVKVNHSRFNAMVERLEFIPEDIQFLAKKITRVEPIHRSSSVTLKLMGRN